MIDASAFSDPDPRKRAQALLDAAEKGEDSELDRIASAIASRFGDEDAFVRFAALDALGRLAAFRSFEIDDGIAAKIVRLANDEHERVRAEVAVAIALLPERRVDAQAKRVLATLLDDESAVVRQEAAAALGDVRDATSADRLAARLVDEDDQVRFEAAFALASLRDARGIDLLVAGLEKPKRRLDSCEALRRLAGRRRTGASTEARWGDAMRDPRSDASTEARSSEAIRDPRSAASAVAGSRTETSAEARGGAGSRGGSTSNPRSAPSAEARGGAGSRGSPTSNPRSGASADARATERAVRELEKLAARFFLGWADRLTVWATLYAIEPSRAWADRIISRTRARNREERSYALALLGTHHITEGADTLAAVARDARDPLRDTAVRALGELADPSHDDLLAKIAADESTPSELRIDAVAALAKLRGAHHA